MMRSVASRLDRMGFRRSLAVAMTLARKFQSSSGQSFGVDKQGHWVNRQREATLVSPTIFTESYASAEAWVVDNWLWGYRPKPGETVIDVGAGIGGESIVFSKLVGPNGRVIAIEAHPGTFECLRGTMAYSRVASVTPVWCAIAGADGVVHIEDSEQYIANSILPERGSLEVPARSLDSLSEELGLGRVALLKMNIEGAERLAVQGMDGLAERLENVVISCHDFISDGGGQDSFRTFDAVKAALEGFGFDLTTRPDHPHPWVPYYLYGRNRALS